MPLRSNLDEFRREARATALAMRRDADARLQQVGEHAFERVVANTEAVGAVDTGAYRAEHVIEQDGRCLYEHPERPGDTVFPSQKAIGAPPLIGPPEKSDAAAGLAGRTPLRGFSIVNRRFVADWLENGTSQMEPRRIYATARDATEAFAEQVAQAASDDPRLRGR